MSAEESHRKRILQEMGPAIADRKVAEAIEFGEIYLFNSVYNQTEVHELLGIVERVNLRTLKTKIISTDSEPITDWAERDDGYHAISYYSLKSFKKLEDKDLPLYINHVFTSEGKKILSEIS